MAKKFTTKKYRLRSRAEKRRFKLKVRPQTKGIKKTPEKINDPVIKSLEARVREIEKSNQGQ